MGSVFSFLRQHKVAAIVASACMAAVIGGTHYYRGTQQPKQQWGAPKFGNNDQFNSKSTYFDDEFDMNKTLYSTISKSGKIDQIVNGIKVNYFPNTTCLEPYTIVEILQNTIELAGDEYASATIKNRQLRRVACKANRSNIYLNYILKYNEDIEEILEKGQAEILNRLDIPKDIFEDSMLMLMDRGFFQQLYMLQASAKQKIKEKIPSKKDLTVKQIKEIIKYHIKILRERPDGCDQYVKKLQQNPEHKELIPLAINLIISDFIHAKFGIEEEDQIRCFQKSESMADQEIHQLLGEIEQAMTNFMSAFGLGGIEQIPESLETFI